MGHPAPARKISAPAARGPQRSPGREVRASRLIRGRDALSRDTMSISELARATGYQSESAFSTAFRRVVGSSPAPFRNQARQQLSSAVSGG
ncbi:helix-turn-helix domain-containing protein [Streptomyces sp. NPDC005047]